MVTSYKAPIVPPKKAKVCFGSKRVANANSEGNQCVSEIKWPGAG